MTTQLGMKPFGESTPFAAGGRAVEYDDEQELTRYVWDFYERVMTPFEQRVGWAHHAAGKAANGHPDVATFILRRHGITGDPEAEAALADGVEVFRRRVCNRLIAEHGAEVFVNRCPNCGRVVRTPRSRQCFSCGFDGHSADVSQPAAPGRRGL